MTDRYLTTSDVAERCRTSESTIRYWRLRGEGPPGFKVGRRVLYREEDVAKWLEMLRAEQGPADPDGPGHKLIRPIPAAR